MGMNHLQHTCVLITWSLDWHANRQLSLSSHSLASSSRSGASLPASVAGGATSRKLLRIVDRITQSKYFQQATEYKYIKRAMEGVSNTRLELRVELKSMIGTLAVNVPPPPTDRLWLVPPTIKVKTEPRCNYWHTSWYLYNICFYERWHANFNYHLWK